MPWLLWLAVALFGFLAFGYVALRVIASRITAEDNGSVCGLQRLGLVAKFSFLCGFSMPRVERFAFFRAGFVSLDPRDGGLRLEEMTKIAERGECSDALIVAFSGGATNKIGLARLEFRKMLSMSNTPTAKLDQLYVLDPTGMSFYEHRIEQFTLCLRRAIKPYKRVIFLGNCMGATAAIRFATLLRSSKDTVLAFNPEVDPKADSRTAFRIAAMLAPRTTGALAGILRSALQSTPARVRIHSSVWPPEYSQAQLLSMSQHGNGNGIIAEINIEKATAAGIREAIEKGCALNSRVLRLVYCECKQHGMLAKELRPSGALREILDRAACPDEYI